VTHVSLRGDLPCLVRKTGHVLCWSPEDAPTLLPDNPLPANAEVRDVNDAVAIGGTLITRASGALSSVELVFDAQGGFAFAARPVGAGVLADVIDADGSTSRGCAVDRRGTVICWGMEAPSR
jgi:hypothetical protein